MWRHPQEGIIMILNSCFLKLLALCVSHGKISYVYEIFIQDKFETQSRTVPRFSNCIQANINEVNLIYQKLLRISAPTLPEI